MEQHGNCWGVSHNLGIILWNLGLLHYMFACVCEGIIWRYEWISAECCA